jgi:adenosylhomocysteine nucleosidase
LQLRMFVKTFQMKRIVGIMGAMPEEIESLLVLLEDAKNVTHGKRTYTSGKINDVPVVIVFSRWGKVAAAATVSALIHEFGITELFFIGVAGAVHPELNIGDVVVATRLIQHDMDARPLMPQFEIPLLGKIFFETDASRRALLKKAVLTTLNDNLDQLIDKKELGHFNISKPKMFQGDIASGDRFFACHDDKETLRLLLPEVLCVEMEGAAVAQVCYEYHIPFTVARTISDSADDKSHIDFPHFIKHIAGRYALAFVRYLFMES